QLYVLVPETGQSIFARLARPMALVPVWWRRGCDAALLGTLAARSIGRTGSGTGHQKRRRLKLGRPGLLLHVFSRIRAAFGGGVRLTVSVRYGFERMVRFAVDEDPAVIRELA